MNVAVDLPSYFAYFGERSLSRDLPERGFIVRLCSLLGRQLQDLIGYEEALQIYAYLACRLLDAAPRSFLLAPASSSGRYHPPDERGPGGTVLYTARVANLASEAVRMLELNDCERVQLALAVLLHDIYKGGPGDTPTTYTWPLHQQAPRALMKHAFEQALSVYDGPGALCDAPHAFWNQVCRAVECHEGRWSVLPQAASGWVRYAGKVGMALHMADYFASRSQVQVILPDWGDAHEEGRASQEA